MTDTVSPPSADADRYLVVGNPIAHSRSPAIHAAFARQTGQNIRYERRLIDKEPATAFAEVMRHFFIGEGGRGANVTLPFKEAAFALADEHSDRARLAGAANTLSFVDGRVLADNTDGAGIVWDILRQGVSLDGCSVTVLGAGGAARGLMFSLLQAGVRQLVVANRTLPRALALAADLNPALEALGFGVTIEALPLADAPSADILINATSAGLQAEGLALSQALFADCRLAYDCVYGARPTAFMQQASAAGVPVVSDGLGMLVGQAAESFRIWRGLMPDAAAVLEELRASIGH